MSMWTTILSSRLATHGDALTTIALPDGLDRPMIHPKSLDQIAADQKRARRQLEDGEALAMMHSKIAEDPGCVRGTAERALVPVGLDRMVRAFFPILSAHER